MTEVKGVRRRRTQILHDLRNRIYWELNEGAEDKKDRNDSLSYEQKEGIRLIYDCNTILLVPGRSREVQGALFLTGNT